MADIKKIDTLKTMRPFNVFDIVFVLVIIVVVALVWFFMLFDTGNSIEIIDNGQVTEYSLSKNREIIIKDKLTVVIEDGYCYIKDSQCPDKVCSGGKIKHVHQMLVCAPFNIIVKVTGKTDIIISTG